MKHLSVNILLCLYLSVSIAQDNLSAALSSIPTASEQQTQEWTPSFTYHFNAQKCIYSFMNTSNVPQDIAVQGWLWDFGDVDGTSFVSNSKHQSYQYSTPGRKHSVSLQLILANDLLSEVYTLTIDVPHCQDCSDSDLAVKVVQLEHAAPTGSIRVRGVGGVEGFSLDDSGYHYAWRAVDDERAVGACLGRSAALKGVVAGSYEVVVTDGMGCKARQVFEIRMMIKDEFRSSGKKVVAN